MTVRTSQYYYYAHSNIIYIYIIIYYYMLYQQSIYQSDARRLYLIIDLRTTARKLQKRRGCFVVISLLIISHARGSGSSILGIRIAPVHSLPLGRAPSALVRSASLALRRESPQSLIKRELGHAVMGCMAAHAHAVRHAHAARLAPTARRRTAQRAARCPAGRAHAPVVVRRRTTP